MSGIEQSTQRQPVDTMFRIFSQWLREDPGHSWEKLINCLKQCGLNVLAEHLQNSLKEPLKGRAIHNHTFHSLTIDMQIPLNISQSSVCKI